MPMLVWLYQFGKPAPQVWHTEQVTGTGVPKEHDPILHYIPITPDEAVLSIADLEDRHKGDAELAKVKANIEFNKE